VDLEHDQLTGAEGIHGGEHGGGDEGAKVATPQRLEREVARHLLEREEDAADGATKGDGHAGGGAGAQDLARLGGVAPVLGEQPGDNVAGADSVVDAGTLLAH
jgi:hypothetical protein